MDGDLLFRLDWGLSRHLFCVGGDCSLEEMLVFEGVRKVTGEGEGGKGVLALLEAELEPELRLLTLTPGILWNGRVKCGPLTALCSCCAKPAGN